MSKDDPIYNWIPDSFDQFRTASENGLVRLTIMDDQYSWLRKNIPISKTSILKRLFLSHSPSYEERLLRMMASNESICKQVQEQGVRFILYKSTN